LVFSPQKLPDNPAGKSKVCAVAGGDVIRLDAPGRAALARRRITQQEKPPMNTQITRWNPFKEMEQMQSRLASLWSHDPLRVNGGLEEALTVTEWNPRVDIVEDDREFLVKVELPEMKREEVKVTVEDGVLSISGERKLEKEEKNKKYHRVEREYGSFVRSFTLPANASGDKVTAEFKDGLLKVHLPKDAKAAPKAIEIKGA
jgi:HSP20 family protein